MHKIVTVEAQPGRTVPIHRDDHRAGHSDHHMLRPGERCEVALTTGIRRRMRAGDLKIVTAVEKFDEGKPESTATIAAVSDVTLGEALPVAHSILGTVGAQPLATPTAPSGK